MTRLRVKKMSKRAEALRIAIAYSRERWLDRRVCFVHFCDGKVKIGRVTKVTDQGMTVVEYQLIPGCDDAPSCLLIHVGRELEVLTVDCDHG